MDKIEELVESLRLTETERQRALMDARDDGKDLTKPIIRQMVVADAQLRKALFTFPLARIMKKELPKNPYKPHSKGGKIGVYDFAQQDMLRWHKESVILLTEEVKG